MRTRCPGCGSEFRCDDAKVGKRTSCPKCSERFVIQPVAAEQAEDHWLNREDEPSPTTDESPPPPPEAPAASLSGYDLHDENATAPPPAVSPRPHPATGRAQPGPTAFRLPLAAVGAGVGAAVGGVVWFALAYYTGYEVGFIAILIGALAGHGAVRAGGGCAPQIGLIAAVAGAVGIFAASYAAFAATVHGEENRELFRQGFEAALASESARASFESLPRAEREQIIDDLYAEARAGGEIDASTSRADYRRTFLNNLDQLSALQMYRAAPPEDREAMFEQAYAYGMSEVTYFGALAEDPGGAAIMGVFGVLGLIYGWRVGSGAGRKG